MTDFIERFSKGKSFEERSKGARKIVEKYSDRVPVIIDRWKNTAPALKKNKYLCPRNLTVQQFAHVVRKHLNLTPIENLFWFIVKISETGRVIKEISMDPSPITATNSLGALYEECKHDDGYLYMCYQKEQTFG